MNQPENILWQVRYLQNKNWLRARELLQVSLQENPQNSKLQLALAELYQSKKLFRKAIVEYQKLFPIFDRKDLVNFRIGNCFLALNEYRLALNYYNILPDNSPELLYNKSFVLSKLNRTDEAIESLEKLFTNNYRMNSELPHIFLAELLYTRRQFDKGIYYLELAEKNYGKKGSIFYLKGLIYMNLQNWLKAYLEFENADKLKVNTPHFLKNYGLVCSKIGKNTKAVDLLLRSIKLAPTDPGAYIEIIKLYLDQNRIMEAYSIAQHAKRNIPYSITLSMLYDQILMKIGKDFVFNKDR